MRIFKPSDTVSCFSVSPIRSRRMSPTLVALAAVLAALADPVSGAFRRLSTYIEFQEQLSAATGLRVCRETAQTSIQNEWTGSGSTAYVECPGACPWDNITANPSWTHFGLPYPSECPPAEVQMCGGIVNGNATSPGFTCPEIANVRGSCIQSPSNGCKYFGAFVFQDSGYGSHGSQYIDYEARCAGPDNETCTWCESFRRPT